MLINLIKKIFKNRENGGLEEDQIPTRPITLRINEKVNIHKMEKMPKIWRGRVHSVSDTTFSVDIPDLMQEFPFPFKERKPVLVSVTRENKSARFVSDLNKIAWKAKPPLLILEYSDWVEWDDVREREYVRIKTDLPAKIKPENGNGDSWKMVRITDFSVTGVSLLSPRPFMKGDRVSLNLLSMQFPLSPNAEVTRISKTQERPEEGALNYDVGLQFSDLSQSDQNLLAAFAHNLQRKSSTL